MKEIKEREVSLLKKIEEEFRDFGFINSSNISYGLVGRGKSGELISETKESTYCLAQLERMDISKYKGEFYFIDSIYKREEISKELSFEYFEFVYTLPMFKGIFINNDSAETAYKRGYSIIKSSTPTNLLGFFVTMRRAIWEFESFGTTWEVFKDAGADPQVAFILAHYYQMNNRGSLFLSDIENPNHAIFSSSSSKLGNANRFIKGICKAALKPPLKLSTKYKGIRVLITENINSGKIGTFLGSIPKVGKEVRGYAFIFQPEKKLSKTKENNPSYIVKQFTKKLRSLE